MYWNLIVIALCALLLLFLLWKEIKRHNKSWLAARIIVSSFAVISLACLALPISINHQQKINNSAATILLTEGFNNDSVQKILSADRDAKTFTTTKSIKAFNATYIPDVSVFSASSDNNKAVHVFGYGMDGNDLSLLKNTPVIFHPATIKNLITSIGWVQKISSGEPLLVQGSFNNTTHSPVKIILSGFDTNLDSASISVDQSYFQLTTIPKHLDKAVYTITILSGKDTLEKEPLPVEVKSTQPLSIIVLAASPDFENKFLINWLAQNEYKFAVRTSISKNKYEKQFVNISPVSLDRITSLLLEKFDVVIADAAELSALPSSDIAILKSYVESKGMGLIVRADSAEKSSSFYANSFPLTETKDSIQHAIKLNFGDTSHSTSPLKIEQPLYIRSLAGTQSLIKDQQMRTLTNSKLYGSGKVILTTIPNSYSWQLSGNNNDYNAYWSWIIQKAAKKKSSPNEWDITPFIPQKNEEVHIKLQTVNANIPQLQSAENILYPEQNYQLPYEWSSSYWPTKSGWQPLITNDGETNWWYVYKNSEWNSVKAMDKIKATKKYESEHSYQSTIASASNFIINKPIPKIYFFIIFFLSACFLWFEKKYRSG